MARLADRNVLPLLDAEAAGLLNLPIPSSGDLGHAQLAQEIDKLRTARKNFHYATVNPLDYELRVLGEEFKTPDTLTPFLVRGP
jgi:hypothetical protein